MTTLSRRGHRILLGGLALIGLAGCAVPRPAPPEPAPTADPAEREVPDRSDDLPPPDDLPDDPGAEEARLRERVQAATDARARGSHRLALAQWLERADRPESAAVEYALVPGGAAPADRAAAWWGLARLHARDGEERAAARARLQAWELEQDRSKTADEVRRSVEALPTADLQRLEFEARGLAGHEMVMREVGDRRRAVGDEAVVIAMLIPVSGRFEQYGAAFRLGAELALAARNEALPEAVPVRVVVRDTEGDIAVAGREAAAAIVDDRASTILGPLLSAPALAAGGVAQAHRVPLIAPTATDPAVRQVGPFVLALDPSPRELVQPIADFAVGRLSLRRFGALVPADGVSAVFESEFRRVVEEAGGSVVLSLVYEPEQRDFRKLLDRLREAEVDGVYMPGGGATLESLAPQLDFYEFDRRVLGHGGWMSTRVLDPGNLALEGALLSATRAELPESDFMYHLREEVWSASRQEVSRFHVRGWQAMEAVLRARDGGAADPEALVEVLSRRAYWTDRPESESVAVCTYGDGVLGPAQRSPGFDLQPKWRSQRPDAEEKAPEDPPAGSDEDSGDG